MAPIGWYASVDALLKKIVGSSTKHQLKSYRKNVLATVANRLYVWLDDERAILSVDLNRISIPPTIASAGGADLEATRFNEEAATILLPSSPPAYDVTSIVVEEISGQRLALVGNGGVNVVQIPFLQRKSSSNKALCSSVEIGERLLSKSLQCEVLGVKWHPGSQTQQHLLVLLSNNTLRLYDCVEGVVETYHLGPSPVFRLNSNSNTNFGRALGETAVDFDFGQATWRHLTTSKNNTDAMQKIYPVYILRGNGDVYSMWLPQPHLRWRSELKGPLSMHPPAEDNYGVDACSILCLNISPQQPPVIIIATSYGMLYHCIALQEEQDPEVISDDEQLSYSLYVYESVELETNNDKQYDSNGPIAIFKDASTNARYHCSHSNGVHTVALPIIQQFKILTDKNTVESDILSSLEDQTCVVEHVVCTKPLATSVSTPVIGLGIVSGVSLGGTTLLCLLGGYEMLTIPLTSTYLDELPRLLSSEDAADLDDQWSSGDLSRAHKEPFDQYIRRLLQRKNANPIYKSEAATVEPPLKDCLHLLNKSSRILREEYIQKLLLAQETIQQRVKVLQDLKVQQLAELNDLNQNKLELSNRAEHLAEKYEELKDNQETIVKRVEKVLGEVLKSAPTLSVAEKDMYNELKKIEDKFKHLKNSIQQVKIKYIDQPQIKPKTTQVANNIELQQIKQFLVTQTNSLSALSEQLKNIHDVIDL